MKPNKYPIFLHKKDKLEQGFSLIETVIALVTLGICFAYAMPLFLYAKINNSKSEIRTGALIVSQRVFDNIRSQKTSDLPFNDGAARESTSQNTDGKNPFLRPTDAVLLADPNLSLPANAPLKLLTYAMGRQYQTKVTYCAGLGQPAIPAVTGPPVVAAIAAVAGTDPTACSTKYRKFKVEVNYNGSKVYDLEGTYTEFE
jgi:prepilin-type N-terminal cleavage/methylation domain-containing protein